ncbi:E3 ubiquitin-protein ligase UPL4 [Abeliophyllum distichum]|uniref:E3 ubiquitin-protein ligase UPL4 n=1 Tax=Abeliophyllum distichum TaxID=126358 RepID=A0ABD1V2S5_9LAMI
MTFVEPTAYLGLQNETINFSLLVSDTVVESSAEAPHVFLKVFTKKGVLFTIYGLFSPDMYSQFTSQVFDGRRSAPYRASSLAAAEAEAKAVEDTESEAKSKYELKNSSCENVVEE